MRLLHLTCQNFRSLTELEIRPGNGFTVIQGDNAQGKTSILEAFLFVTTSKSHRTNSESELCQHGAASFHIRAHVQRNDRDVNLESAWAGGIKRIKINGVAQSKISDVLGKAVVVLFCPEDISLVRGSAMQRRRFVDMDLSQISPMYLAALQQYRQALRQRNQLLKTINPVRAELEPWEEQLDRFGSIIRYERATFVAELAIHTAASYCRIAEREELTLRYLPDAPCSESIRDILTQSRETDVRRGQTTRGPHRDDIDIIVDGVSARSFASQGQRKTATLAVRLAELELIRQRIGEYPVLMLDDVFSELDAARCSRVLGTMTSDIQCLLTTTDSRRLPNLYGAECAYFKIEEGRLVDA